MYPTELSILSGKNLLFPALVNFAAGALAILSISILSSKTDKTFFGLLKSSIGGVGARIVYGFFAAFFVLSAILPIFEHKQYIHAVFYDTASSIVVFLPLFVFTAYAASKKFTNIGRCADICLPIFAVCMFMIFIMGMGEAEFITLLPILKENPQNVLQGIRGTALWFVEPCWLLMFMGHYKYRKGDAARITLSYVGGALVVLLFLAMFFGIYGGIAPSRTFAIARTSLFFSAIESIGRIDLVILFILEVVILFSLALNIQLGVHAASECVGTDKYWLVSLIVNAALAIIFVTFDHFYSEIRGLYYNYFWILILIFAVAVPFAAWLLKRRKNEKPA